MGADVVALPIARGRVVDGEEHPSRSLQREPARIEGDAHHLGVPGPPAAHGLVVRIGRRAARIARLDREHAVELVEHGFEAPEAAAAEDRNLGRG